MASDYVGLTDTIDNLYEREDYKETMNTLNIIANLLWELGNTRPTGAVYQRTIKHGKLTVTVDYRE